MKLSLYLPTDFSHNHGSAVLVDGARPCQLGLLALQLKLLAQQAWEA